jgi:hypothetical protein
MIPSTQTQTRELISTMDSSPELSFSIKSLSNIFELLHKSMYNDKPTAVAREVISNAIDANIESRSGKKTIVTLPTRFIPTFTVQDFGVGIDKERLECFSSYGASTKTNTNKEIGGFGLGAKSPWSITDQFTITTICHNIKYKYLCYMDDKGIGKVKELFAIATDEPSGTTMEIPVSDSDHVIAIQRQAHLFALCNQDKIEIVNGDYNIRDIYESKQHTVSLKGFMPANYHVYDWSYIGIRNSIIFVNGYVPYVLPITSEFSALINNHYTVLVKFDIGVLDLPATRELLSNTPKNNKIINKVRKTITNGIAKLKTFLEQRKEKNEQLGAITTRWSPVRISLTPFDHNDIHSIYRRSYDGHIERVKDRFAVPIKPGAQLINYIAVLITDKKNTKISFNEYAEYILEKFPNYGRLYFVDSSVKDQKLIRDYQIIPIHCFTPPIKKKLKPKKIVNDDNPLTDINLVENVKVINCGISYVTIADIKSAPDEYRKVETYYDDFRDYEIKKHIEHLNKDYCVCNYKIILVPPKLTNKLKSIKLLDKDDFVLSKSVYKNLVSVNMARYLLNRLIKSSRYTPEITKSVKEYFTNNILYLNTSYHNPISHYCKPRRITLLRFKAIRALDYYELDKDKFKELKRVAYIAADQIFNLIETDPTFVIYITNNLLIPEIVQEFYIDRVNKILESLQEKLS